MKLLPAAALLSVCLLSFSANAQEVIGLQEQIDALKDEMMILNRKVYRDNNDVQFSSKPSSSAEVEMTQYSEIIRSLNGKIDELEHKITQLESKIDTINNDMNVRFNLLEGKGVPAAQGSISTPKKFDTAVANGAPKSITGDAITTGNLQNLTPAKKAEPVTAPAETQMATADVNTLYTNGLEALKNRNSALAEQNFKLILDKYSSDKLAGNAQYWLGEVYYNDKVFDKAAVAFGRGYEKYKNGAKGPDCLLKLGLSMAQLGKKNEACLAFVNLPNEFPQASGEIKNKAAQEAKKYNCQ